MAAPVTLAQLRSDSRLWADQRDSGSDPFITDPELDRIINVELAKLYDRLVAARGQWRYQKDGGSLITPADFGICTLPDDFYETIAIYDATGAPATAPVEIPAATLEDAAILIRQRYTRGCRAGYLMGGGGKFTILPYPPTTSAFLLQYIPVCPTLTDPADTFDGVNGWDEAVSLGAAIRMRMIEETDYSDIARLYADAIERIDKMAAEREAREPSRVRDVSPEARFARGVWWW